MVVLVEFEVKQVDSGSRHFAWLLGIINTAWWLCAFALSNIYRFNTERRVFIRDWERRTTPRFC